MAIEAARQLQSDYHQSWQISQLQPSGTSVISSVLREKEHVNLHLNTFDIEGNREYLFQILALDQNINRECSGKIRFREHGVSLPDDLPAVSDDQDLKRAGEWLNIDAFPSILKDVKVGPLGCSGTYDCNESSESCLTFEILHAIVCLIPFSTSNSLFPGKPNIISIGSISTHNSRVVSPTGYFRTSTETFAMMKSISTIHMFDRDHVIVVAGLVIQVDSNEVAQPPLKCLFSLPLMLPDITQNGHMQIESLQHLIDLVLHKWPMADIGVCGFSDQQVVRTLVEGFRRRRSSYRSISVEHPQPFDVADVKVRFVDEMKSGVNLLLLGDTGAPDAEGKVEPQGIICTPSSRSLGHGRQAFANFPSSVGEDWLAYRRLGPKTPTSNSSTSIFFTDRPLSVLGALQADSEVVALDPSVLARFCTRDDVGKYQAVVVETAEKSAIATWKGSDILPWLQHLLASASSIIWVTRSRRSNPFHHGAGILLRTLQAEQPSLRVTWIVCGEDESDLSVMERVEQALAFLDENEIKHDWKKNSPNILRIVPDDRLSAMVGLAPPLIAEAVSRSSGGQCEVVGYQRVTSLLDTNGVYVVVGGLGGLGRYVCSWMASQGARKLAVISRSGTASAGAHDAVDELRLAGVSIHVLKADASNSEAMSASFAEIRKHGQIKGVINMVLVLADVPFSIMTGPQWDTGIRLKIDSSWILHQETLDDKPDLFLLFSSIASILGNRNQANYNIGNSFLNALAEYRHSIDLPAVSIALGAMTEIGVLHESGIADLMSYLSKSALTPLTRYDLGKILEAAIIESPRRERPVIVTGLEMLQRVNGKVVGKDQTQLIWTEWPEVSSCFLMIIT